MAKGLPYLLPRADKTVSHKLGGLKKKKKKELNSLIVVEIRSPKSRCQQDEFLLEDL